MSVSTKLSPDLIPIYEYEIARGNVVKDVFEPAGTRCPYAVYFTKPLDHSGIQEKLSLSPAVRYHQEDGDPHYAPEGLFQSETSRHIVSGPLKA